MSKPERFGVIARPEFADEAGALFARVPLEIVRDEGSIRAAIQALLDEDIEVVACYGDDRLAAQIWTTYHRHSHFKQWPLRLYPMPVGDSRTLAGAAGVPGASKKAASVFGKALRGQRLQRISVPSLRITSSANSSATLGFNVGLGVVHRIFSAYRRTGRRGAAGLAGTVARLAADAARGKEIFEPPAVELSIDYDVRESVPGFLLMSSLRRSWFDVDMSEKPSFREGDGLELLRQSSRLGRLIDRSLGQAARSFERVHIDGNSGYVVDGELSGSVYPQILQIAPGPQVQLVVAK